MEMIFPSVIGCFLGLLIGFVFLRLKRFLDLRFADKAEKVFIEIVRKNL